MNNRRDKEKASSSASTGRYLNIVVCVFGVFMSLYLVWYSFNENRLFRDSIVDQFQSHQKTIAMGVSQAMESMLRGLVNDMKSLSVSPRVKDCPSPECGDRIQEFYFINQDMVYAGYRMDSLGVLVYMFPKDDKALNADISGQEHVIRFFKTGKLMVSGLFHAVEGFDAIAIHAPVYDKGELTGSVATIIKLSKLTQFFIHRIRPGRNGYAWLIDENDIILDYPMEKYIGKKLTETDLFPADVMKQLQERVSRHEPDSMRIGDTLFAVSPTRIGDRTWTVVLSTPYRDISGPIEEHWGDTLLVSISVFALFIFVGLVVLRSSRIETEKRLLEEKVGLEEELRESRDRFEMIVRTVPSGIYMVDKNKIVQTWNGTAEKILGYAAEEIVGKPCGVFATEECRTICGLFEADMPKPMFGGECRYRTKDGRALLVSKNIDFVYDAKGNIIGGIESFIDITEARLAEKQKINSLALAKEIEQLKKMDEVKSNFLSMVSHELRTPLSVMLGNLSMARNGRYGQLPEKFVPKLDVVIRRGWQLNDLIANLLDLAKIESGKLDLKKEELDIADGIRDVITELSEAMDRKSLEVSVDISPEASVVRADPTMFNRLMVNLLANSIKFTPEKGTIKISSGKKDENILIIIRDTGIGIPEQMLPRVFDRFFQVDNSSTRKYGGTGLGLSIAREIMNVHKGWIGIDSREGAGTEVRVYFPISDPISTPPAGWQVEKERQSAATLPTPYFKEPLTFLFVGSDSEFLTHLTDLFDGTSHRVLSAQNHRDASSLRRENISVVLLDLDTPELGEDEILIWKKTFEDIFPIAFIGVSGSEDRDVMKKAAAANMQFLIGKPLDPQELIEKIKSIVK